MSLIVLGLLTGGLNALRGSGYLKVEFKMKALSFVLKWLLIPASIAIPTWAISGSLWLALCASVPYYLKMGTGTGGDMQARSDNTSPLSFNPHEMRPFDDVANVVANLALGRSRPFREPPSYFSLEFRRKWHQIWGFTYCTLWAFVFVAPFIFTDVLFAFPLLLYPVMVRYMKWRAVEFTFLGMYCFLFLISIY